MGSIYGPAYIKTAAAAATKRLSPVGARFGNEKKKKDRRCANKKGPGFITQAVRVRRRHNSSFPLSCISFFSCSKSFSLCRQERKEMTLFCIFVPHESILPSLHCREGRKIKICPSVLAIRKSRLAYIRNVAHGTGLLSLFSYVAGEEQKKPSSNMKSWPADR